MARSRMGRQLTIVTTLALVLTRCGGESAPSPDEVARMDEDEVVERAKAMDDLSGVEPCQLLTAAEIQAATGIAPGAAQDMSQLDGQLPICAWPSADGSEIQLVQVLVTRSMLQSYEEFMEQARQQLGEDLSEGDWQPVDVGDFGVWIDMQAAGGMLQVHDDGRMVQVAVQAAEGRDDRAAAQDLALKAFDRLR